VNRRGRARQRRAVPRLLDAGTVRLGRPIRHRLLAVAILGLVTAALSADALYRAISVTRTQRLERGREAVHEEIDRLRALGPGAVASTASSIVGLRAGLAAGPEAAATAVPAPWANSLRTVMESCRSSGVAADTIAEADGGQLVARAAPAPGGGLYWAAVSLRPSAALQSWRLLVVALGFSALLLVASASYSLLAVRRAVAGLQGALAALGDDLSAPVPRSQIRELDDIAIGIAALAKRLDDARRIQERLGRDLARQERLAALGRVVAGVAHEVRNPLASIKLRLDLAARTEADLPSAARAAIAHASSEITRLDRLVADLLIVAGREVGAPAPVELGTLLRMRADALAPWAALREISLVARGAALTVGDPDAIARALDNVLRNAIEASPDGGAVEAMVGEKDGSPSVRICDRGPGVPAGRAGEMFEPFFTTKPDGTGLGLAISRAIARAHGGDLTYAREGDVTVLELSLPAATVVPERAPTGRPGPDPVQRGA
jgi:signal transduction histidine kinase